MLKFFYQVVLFFALSTSIWFSASSADVMAAEKKIKVVFLFNFAKFIEWPGSRFANENSPVNICLTGSDNEYSIARRLEGKKAKGRVITLEFVSLKTDFEHCHILFITQLKENEIIPYLFIAQKQSILTVGQSPYFSDIGGIINLINVGNKIRFEVNLAEAKKKSLNISSKLLRLARNIRSEEG